MVLSLDIGPLIGLAVLFMVVALFYSAVGFGGGSSYLAILALFVTSFFTIRSLALLCNIIVVGGSTYWFVKQGHFKGKAFMPFIISSIPMAYLGARFRLSEELFFILLGASLILAAVFLFWQPKRSPGEAKNYPLFFNMLVGGGIGMLSGLVGIGGGIFLAPLLHYIKWKEALVVAALSSLFILVNSVSSLVGLLHAETLSLPWPEAFVLGGAVLLGGQIGIRISLNKLSPQSIRRVTAALVFVVGIRVLLVNGLA